MAKGKTKANKRNHRPESDVSVPRDSDREGVSSPAEEQDRVAGSQDEQEPDMADEIEVPDESGAAPRRLGGIRRGSAVSRVGGLAIYKPGQGYYTRVGTAIFAGVLIACFWQFLYSEMEIYVEPDKAWTQYLQLGLPTLFLIGLGLLVYWVVGLNARSCDFMILTEGEIKKVSWSSKKEVIGSTKVVIFTVVVMGMLLFTVDVVFAWFFHVIGVLQMAPGVFNKMMSDAL